MNQVLKVILVLTITITLMGLLFAVSRNLRPDHTDEMCRVRLLRMGQAVALYVEDHGGAAFPAIRNPTPLMPWEPQQPFAADTLLRPYLGGIARLPQPLPQESREAWQARLRNRELSVCPATGFPYLSNSELLRSTPSAFTRIGTADWVFRCQGRTASAGAHKKDGQSGVQRALLGTAERTINTSERDAITAELRDVEIATATLPDGSSTGTPDQLRQLVALRQRVAALDRAFSDGRTTTAVRRLVNDIDWIPYP